MSAPRFSIITVCLNAEAHIAEAIESVLAQDTTDYEYVVADGRSSDATLAIVRANEPRFGGRLSIASEPDAGLYDAMNRALARASGDYVEFLGADDRLLPGALSAVGRVLDADEPADIVCGRTHVFSATASWDEPPRRVLRRGMLARVPASHQATFVRREAIAAVGGFDLRFGIAADYDLYLRLIEAGCSEVYIDETLAEFRLGGVSSRDALSTARDYRDVRVAHGANPLVESLVMLKSAAAATAFSAWKQVVRSGRTRTQDEDAR